MRIRFPFAIGFVILLIFSSSIGLLPHSVLPSTPESAKKYIPQQSDKAVHFVVFFALTATFYFIFDTARRRVLHLTLIICTGILAVGSEVAQGLLPNDRDFDPWDVLANVIGSGCALALAAAYHKRAAERRRRAKYSALTGEGLDDEDLELGDGPGLGARVNGDREGQESGVISVDRPRSPPPAPKPKTVEEELDNWDENVPDDWDEEEDPNNGPAKVTPATSSADDEEVSRKKLAVD